MKPIIFYQDYKSTLNNELKKVKSKIAYLGFSRLISFLLIGFFIYSQWKNIGALHYILIALGIIIFIWLIKLSANAISLKEAVIAQIKVIENEISHLDNGSNMFSNGESFQQYNSTTYDLDLFGSKSLFHYLNRTHTNFGNEELTNRIIHSELDIKKLEIDQKKVTAFSKLPKLNIELAAYFRIKEDTYVLKNMQGWIQDPTIYFTSSKINILKWIIPVLSGIMIIISILTESFIWASIPFLIFLPLSIKLSTKGFSLQQKITDFESYIFKYTTFLESFLKHTKDNEVLKEEYDNANIAFQSLRKLHRHLEMLESSNNLLVKLFLNSYIFYEIHCLAKIEQWKITNQKSFKTWEALIGKIEYFESIGSFTFNHPQYKYPTFVEGKPMIEAKEIVHPLMLSNPVSNNFTIGDDEKMVLLTGSNMSGKTTFLRTIGVNVILGQLGAPVAAVTFSYTPLKVLTSIRVSDSLQENTSYFKAELNQLKQIIEEIKTGSNKILVLIDEILKGTNSDDKTSGSAAYMKQLMSHECLCIFATHDLILSNLEKEFTNKMTNYCFESIIENNQLHFNYLIQKGVAKNKNASFLMKQMGIIE